MIHTYMLLPRNPSRPDASWNQIHTTLVHMTAYRVDAIRTYPDRINTTNDGINQIK